MDEVDEWEDVWRVWRSSNEQSVGLVAVVVVSVEQTFCLVVDNQRLGLKRTRIKLKEKIKN